MRGLPAGSYFDPARGPLDVATLLGPGWQFVCHVADLPAAGTAARFDCGARSAFVLRTRTMELRAFRNVCGHRGSRLLDGDRHTGLAFCVDGRVRCPYHGWTYDEQGRLESIPAGQRFEALDRGDEALPALAVGEWRGLVFVALENPARPLDEAFGAAGADWPDVSAMRRLGEPRVVTVEADWKLVCEHALYTAHLAVVRPMPPSRLFEPRDYAAAGADAWRAAGVPVDPARASWSARRYLALADGTGDALIADFRFLWPNQWLCRTADTLTILQALPAGAGRSRIRLLRYGSHVLTREARVRRHLHERIVRGALAQDAAVLERMQQGLTALDAGASLPLDAAQPALAAFVERCRAASVPASARRARRPRKAATTTPA